jgi:hypothetical protein
VIGILLRVARREKRAKHKDLADDYKALVKKLKKCRPNARCGSLACPLCARAFQRAKVAAQENLIAALEDFKSDKQLVMVTLVPLDETFTPDELKSLDIRKKNRWLKDFGAHF